MFQKIKNFLKIGDQKNRPESRVPIDDYEMGNFIVIKNGSILSTNSFVLKDSNSQLPFFNLLAEVLNTNRLPSEINFLELVPENLGEATRRSSSSRGSIFKNFVAKIKIKNPFRRHTASEIQQNRGFYPVTPQRLSAESFFPRSTNQDEARSSTSTIYENEFEAAATFTINQNLRKLGLSLQNSISAMVSALPKSLFPLVGLFIILTQKNLAPVRYLRSESSLIEPILAVGVAFTVFFSHVRSEFLKYLKRDFYLQEVLNSSNFVSQCLLVSSLQIKVTFETSGISEEKNIKNTPILWDIQDCYVYFTNKIKNGKNYACVNVLAHEDSISSTFGMNGCLDAYFASEKGQMELSWQSAEKKEKSSFTLFNWSRNEPFLSNSTQFNQTAFKIEEFFNVNGSWDISNPEIDPFFPLITGVNRKNLMEELGLGDQSKFSPIFRGARLFTFSLERFSKEESKRIKDKIHNFSPGESTSQVAQRALRKKKEKEEQNQNVSPPKPGEDFLAGAVPIRQIEKIDEQNETATNFVFIFPPNNQQIPPIFAQNPSSTAPPFLPQKLEPEYADLNGFKPPLPKGPLNLEFPLNLKVPLDLNVPYELDPSNSNNFELEGSSLADSNSSSALANGDSRNDNSFSDNSIESLQAESETSSFDGLPEFDTSNF